MITQSVGVPLTAKWRLPRSRIRSGSANVKEWEAPLLSVSGATTQTSSVRSVAIFSSTPSPGASIPSSLVSRIRMGGTTFRRPRAAFSSLCFLQS